MAEKKKHIDELARDLMQGYEESTPADNVWSTIKRRLFFYNLTKKIWFWMSVSSMIILLTVVFANGLNTGHTPQQTAQQAHKQTSIDPQKQTAKEDIATTNQRNTASINQQQDTDSNQSINSKRNSVNTKEKNQNIASENQDTADKQHANLTPDNTNKQTGNNNENRQKNYNYDDSESRLAWELLQKKTESDNYFNFEQKQNHQSDINDAAHLSANEKKQNRGRLLSAIRPISVSAELFGSYNYSGFLLDKIDKTDPAIINLREESEQPAWSFSGGIGLRLDYSRFFLQAEAIYQSYRSTATYNWTQTTIVPDKQMRIDTIKDYNIDTINTDFDSTEGIWQYETDTSYNQMIDTTLIILSDTFVNHYTARTFQQLQYWEFPLIIGHSWQFNSWQLEASTGLAVGFYTGSSGQIIKGTNYELIQYDRKVLPFRDVNYIWLGRAGMAYKLNNKFSAFSRLSMRYSLNDMFDNYEMHQRPWSIGVNLGMRFKL